METLHPQDYLDPLATLTRGFHGQTPRDLSGVSLEIATLATRSSSWSAHGILPPAVLTELGAAGVLEEPVELHVMAHPLLNEGKIRVRMRGFCWGAMQLTCVRCLVDFHFPLEVTIDACYAAGIDPAIKNKRWQFDEDLIYLANGLIKMKRLAEEELLLALPMNPVCVSGCAGLCAGCGVDLNRTPCSCQKAAPLGPFAILKKLKSA